MSTNLTDPNLTLTLESWQPGDSGLPGDLFQPHCIIQVSYSDGTEPPLPSLSWPYGGGGTCTLGPLLPVLPPPGSKPTQARLTIPRQSPLSVGVTASSTEGPSSLKITFYLLNDATNQTGQFMALGQLHTP